MRIFCIISALTLFSTATGAAAAQEQAFYIDAGGGIVTGEITERSTFGIVQGHAGLDFNRHFGVEAELAIGVADEQYDSFTESINFSGGAFGRLKVPLNNTTEVFSRIGYVTTEFETSDALSTITIDSNGPAFGAGLTTLFVGNTGIRFDYTRYNYKIDVLGADIDVTADAFTLGLYQRF